MAEGFRVGSPLNEESDKNPQVLVGPAKQIGSREIRPRSVREEHIAPDSIKPFHLSEGIVNSDSDTDGRYFVIGQMQVCTHKVATSGGTATWTYPKTFPTAPVVTATVNGTAARIATVSAVTDTAVSVAVFDDSGASQDATVEMVAVGIAFVG